MTPVKERRVAKSQKKSNREVRKPKADKAPKQNASNPSTKVGVVAGLDNMKK
jgi:phage antirepressor YoqD-like protein